MRRIIGGLLLRGSRVETSNDLRMDFSDIASSFELRVYGNSRTFSAPFSDSILE